MIFGRVLAIVLSLFFVPTTKTAAQENKDLFYAQPANTGLYLGLLYIDSDNSVLVGMQKLYLLNKQRLFVDSLNLAGKDNSYLANVYHATITEKNLLSVSTLQRALLIEVRENKFHIKKAVLNSDMQKKLGKFDLFILFKDGLLARSSKGKSQAHHFFIESGSTGYLPASSKNITPERPRVTDFKGSEIFGFSDYQTNGKSIYIFQRKQNMLWKYEPATDVVKEIALPAVKIHNEANEFFLDPHTGKRYLFSFSSDDRNKVFEFSDDDSAFREVAQTKYMVRGVFSGKLYISGVFDGTVAHYLIPLNYQNQELLFIDR